MTLLGWGRLEPARHCLVLRPALLLSQVWLARHPPHQARQGFSVSSPGLSTGWASKCPSGGFYLLVCYQQSGQWGLTSSTSDIVCERGRGREVEVGEEFILDLVNFHWSEVSLRAPAHSALPHLTALIKHKTFPAYQAGSQANYNYHAIPFIVFNDSEVRRSILNEELHYCSSHYTITEGDDWLDDAQQL